MITVNKMIDILTQIVEQDPTRGDLEVFVWNSTESYPVEIDSIDNSILDRIDINAFI